MDNNKSKGIFFRLVKDKTTIFLLGSIHVGKSDFFPLEDKVEEAFEKSQQIFVELDNSSSENIQKTQELSANHSIFTDGETLKSSISDDSYEILRNCYNEVNIDITTFDNLKPWFVVSMVGMYQAGILGYDSEEGVDLHFLKRESGKKIVELESVEEQIGVVLGYTKEDIEFMIREIRPLEEAGEALLKLSNAWRDGDEKGMYEFFAAIEKEEGLFEKLVGARNRIMADKIDKCATDAEFSFVIVGSGHLIGKGSVIEMLLEKGYGRCSV